MAEKITYLINDPGTNNIYSVVLDEASRSEITSQKRVSEIVQFFIGSYLNDIDISTNNSMTPADILTIGKNAAQDIKDAGYI